MAIFAAAGRRSDAIDAPIARFPVSRIGIVSLRIRHIFVQHEISKLFVSAAAGADLIAIEQALLMNASVYIFLPTDINDFKAASVVDREGPWSTMYRSYVEMPHPGVVVRCENMTNDEGSYFKLNSLLLAQLPTDAGSRVLVAWDGLSRGRNDVTEQFIQEARRLNFAIDEIDTL